MRCCDKVAKWPIPCTDEFFATVTEGVVYGVYKLVTRLYFCVTRRHKVSGGIGCFATVSQGRIPTSMIVERQGYFAQCP